MVYDVMLWVLPTMLVGMAIGFYLGRGLQSNQLRQLREKTLDTLATVLESADQMTNDVDHHNSTLAACGRRVQRLNASAAFEDIQQALLTQISTIFKANQRLEDDLVCARYQLIDQSQELDRTRYEARTDALSGVSNRKAFDETLNFLLSNFKRRKRLFSLVLMDVDHFKWINDTHGHSAGDRVVTHIGRVLKELVRPSDHVARFGGDEFALLLPKTDAALAARVANRVRVAVHEQNFDVGPRGERVAVTFSMGVATVRAGDTYQSLLERVDAALYQSKQGGRNQLHSYPEEGELVKILA